jgi:hypothetical protein
LSAKEYRRFVSENHDEEVILRSLLTSRGLGEDLGAKVLSLAIALEGGSCEEPFDEPFDWLKTSSEQRLREDDGGG